jgi:hypothetical protein
MMSDSTRRGAPRTPGDGPPLVADWTSTLFATATQAQRLQFEALLGWQAALAALHQEIWDEWVCHFAGGMPIDG